MTSTNRPRIGDDHHSRYEKVIVLGDDRGVPLASPTSVTGGQVQTSGSIGLEPNIQVPAEPEHVPRARGKRKGCKSSKAPSYLATDPSTLFVDIVTCEVFVVPALEHHHDSRLSHTPPSPGLRAISIPTELWYLILVEVPLSTLLDLLDWISTLEKMQGLGNTSGVRTIIEDKLLLEKAVLAQWGDHQPPAPPPDMPLLKYCQLLLLPYCSNCRSTRYTKFFASYMLRLCPDCRESLTCDFSTFTVKVAELLMLNPDSDLMKQLAELILSGNSEVRFPSRKDRYNHQVWGRISYRDFDGSIFAPNRLYLHQNITVETLKLKEILQPGFETDAALSNTRPAIVEYFGTQIPLARSIRVQARNLEVWYHGWLDRELANAKLERATRRREFLVLAATMQDPLPEYLLLESQAFKHAGFLTGISMELAWPKLQRQIEREKPKLLEIDVWDPEFRQCHLITQEVFEIRVPGLIDRAVILRRHPSRRQEWYRHDYRVNSLFIQYGFEPVPPFLGHPFAIELYRMLLKGTTSVYRDATSRCRRLTGYEAEHTVVSVLRKALRALALGKYRPLTFLSAEEEADRHKQLADEVAKDLKERLDLSWFLQRMID